MLCPLVVKCCLVLFGDEDNNHCVISELDNRHGAVMEHAVMCVESVWCSSVQGDCAGRELACAYYSGSSCEDVQDQVAERGIMSGSSELRGQPV